MVVLTTLTQSKLIWVIWVLLTFAGLGGSGPVEANDDVMPSANEESWANSCRNKSGAADGSEGNNNFTLYTYHINGWFIGWKFTTYLLMQRKDLLVLLKYGIYRC